MSARLVRPAALMELRKKLTRVYPFGGPERAVVPDDKIDWHVPFEDYNPPSFTSNKVLTAAWADKEDIASIKFNAVDQGVNRVSHCGKYSLDCDGYPLNPVGRTGIRGRGNIGRWGVNLAVDPIVTRWKSGLSNAKSTGRVLQFVAIQRRDTGEWAIPGGMLDIGETVENALKREFLEEVFSIDDANEETRAELELAFRDLFLRGVEVYKGYVDDPRNTDNAWIETDCRNFHVDDPQLASLPLKAGSDAKNAQWVDISRTLSLYASHKALIEKVVEKRQVEW